MDYKIHKIYSEFCFKSRQTGVVLDATKVMEDLNKFIKDCFRLSEFKLLKWFLGCFTEEDPLALARYIIHDGKKEQSIFADNYSINRRIPLIGVILKILKVSKFYKSDKLSMELKSFIVESMLGNLDIMYLCYNLSYHMKLYPFSSVEKSINDRNFGNNNGEVTTGEFISYYMNGLEHLFNSDSITIEFPNIKPVSGEDCIDTVHEATLFIHTNEHPNEGDNYFLKGKTSMCYFIQSMFNTKETTKCIGALVLSKLGLTATEDGRISILVSTKSQEIAGVEYDVVQPHGIMNGFEYSSGFSIDEAEKYTSFLEKVNDYVWKLHNKGLNFKIYALAYIQAVMSRATSSKKEIKMVERYMDNLEVFSPERKLSCTLS